MSAKARKQGANGRFGETVFGADTTFLLPDKTLLGRTKKIR